MKFVKKAVAIAILSAVALSANATVYQSVSSSATSFSNQSYTSNGKGYVTVSGTWSEVSNGVSRSGHYDGYGNKIVDHETIQASTLTPSTPAKPTPHLDSPDYSKERDAAIQADKIKQAEYNNRVAQQKNATHLDANKPAEAGARYHAIVADKQAHAQYNELQAHNTRFNSMNPPTPHLDANKPAEAHERYNAIKDDKARMNEFNAHQQRFSSMHESSHLDRNEGAISGERAAAQKQASDSAQKREAEAHDSRYSRSSTHLDSNATDNDRAQAREQQAHETRYSSVKAEASHIDQSPNLEGERKQAQERAAHEARYSSVSVATPHLDSNATAEEQAQAQERAAHASRYASMNVQAMATITPAAKPAVTPTTAPAVESVPMTDIKPAVKKPVGQPTVVDKVPEVVKEKPPVQFVEVPFVSNMHNSDHSHRSASDSVGSRNGGNNAANSNSAHGLGGGNHIGGGSAQSGSRNVGHW